MTGWIYLISLPSTALNNISCLFSFSPLVSHPVLRCLAKFTRTTFRVHPPPQQRNKKKWVRERIVRHSYRSMTLQAKKEKNTVHTMVERNKVDGTVQCQSHSLAMHMQSNVQKQLSTYARLSSPFLFFSFIFSLLLFAIWLLYLLLVSLSLSFICFFHRFLFHFTFLCQLSCWSNWKFTALKVISIARLTWTR